MDLLKCVLTWSLVYFLPTLPLSLHLRPAQLEVLNPIHSLLLIFLVAIHFRIKLLITLSYVRAALDFTPDPQTVVFPVGSSVGERRCIDIPLNDDVLVEVPESFSVIAASTDPNVEFSPGGNVATVTITDNDSKKLADWYSIIMTIINQFFFYFLQLLSSDTVSLPMLLVNPMAQLCQQLSWCLVHSPLTLMSM